MPADRADDDTIAEPHQPSRFDRSVHRRPPNRRAVLEAELALRRRDVDLSETGAEHTDMALVPDRQGIGVSAGRSNGR
jgi:hypothetical protein